MSSKWISDNSPSVKLDSYILPALQGVSIALLGFSTAVQSALSSTIEANNGTCVSNTATADLIVCDDMMDSACLSTLPKEKAASLVTVAWLDESIRLKQFVDPAKFCFEASKLLERFQNTILEPSSLFENTVFCVKTSQSELFTELMRIVSKAGGFVTSNLTTNSNFIVSDFKKPEFSADSVDFYNLAVVKPLFILDCLKENKILSPKEYYPTAFPVLNKGPSFKEYAFNTKSDSLSALDIVVLKSSFSEKEMIILETLLKTHQANYRLDSSSLQTSSSTLFVSNDGYFATIMMQYKKCPLVSARFIEEWVKKDVLLSLNTVKELVQTEKKLFFLPLTFKGPIQEIKGKKICVLATEKRNADKYNYTKVLELMGCKIVELKWVFKQRQ